MAIKRAIIIGGGFTGSLTAINISRHAAGPLHLTVVNGGYPAVRGVAYRTRHRHHLLNVAARNMSALADQPGHFVDWLQTREEYADEPLARLREKFAPRAVYGDYLASLFLWHTRAAADKGIQIESVAAEAVDVEPGPPGARVALADGRALAADAVVLATGNQAPAPLRVPGLSPADPRYVANPWQGWEGRLADKTENVVLIGTGLTAVDAILSFLHLGWQGKIVAVSRHGLLPLCHFRGAEYGSLIEAGERTARLGPTMRGFNQSRHRIVPDGIHPAVLVDQLRPSTQRIWQGFTLDEKRRFHRHLRTRWSIARHRIAPSIHQALHQAMGAGRLEIVPGRIEQWSEAGDQFVLTVRTETVRRRLEAGFLVNCTGPAESASAQPLLRRLLERGLLRADEMDLGVEVSPEFAALDRSGRASDFLFALGPILKGSLWESSAVPELRSQALRLGEILARRLSGRSVAELKEDPQAVLEYQI